jgi:hypothetical protein
VIDAAASYRRGSSVRSDADTSGAEMSETPVRRSERATLVANSGSANSDFASEAASCAGLVPSARTATF